MIIQYKVRENYPPLKVEDNATHFFYLQLKKKEPDLIQFPLCITVEKKKFLEKSFNNNILQQKSITQTDLVSISEHSSTNTESNNQNSDYLNYTKIMTDILQLEDGNEESSTICNKTATKPEKV